jgi:hypothetical protein
LSGVSVVLFVFVAVEGDFGAAGVLALAMGVAGEAGGFDRTPFVFVVVILFGDVDFVPVSVDGPEIAVVTDPEDRGPELAPFHVFLDEFQGFLRRLELPFVLAVLADGWSSRQGSRTG